MLTYQKLITRKYFDKAADDGSLVGEANPFAGAEPDDDDLDEGVVDRGDDLAPAEPKQEEPPKEEPNEDEPAEGDDDAESESEPTEGESDEPKAEADDADAEKGDKDSDDDDDKTPSSISIPKRRFDEVNERRKRAEARLKELEEAQAKSTQAPEKKVDFDFDTKEDEYMEAVLDNDREKARAIRAEIREAERTMYQVDPNEITKTVSSQTKAERELDTVINALETDHPVLDPSSTIYDPEVVTEVLELQEAFILQKYSPADAMNRAARYVLGGTQESTDSAEADADASEPDTAHQERRTKQVKQKIKTSKQQPPRAESGTPSSEHGEGADINVDDLSDEEFDALPESKKRELRGDIV